MSAPPLPARQSGYAGDFTGAAAVEYRPDPDGQPDPGEIVWTWVPYEEDHSRGKDRPVLIVGRDGPRLLALMLTSRDHDGGPGADDYVDIGVGAWDHRRRPSEVRLDRILRIDPAAVRREGAVLSRPQFELVAGSLRTRHGWH
ncbi:type II toxin-antitoxin system PemK/MazF family toxin [Sinomonas halotolerans]|uniref:Type II toxin-antitoxin system PemK/MazF family toxin n=1 Tax=Sinomonas halotolerans TaxID=1644133 RepID=A0ABU9X0S5_9MICC